VEWFSNWWENLSLIEQVLACFAIPMSVVMVLQLVLSVIGLGFGTDTDGDVDDSIIEHNAEASPPDGNKYSNPGVFKIFTIRGIVAFFALGGWAGLAGIAAGIPPFWAIQLALFVGVCALLLAAIVIKLALKMQTSGNINLNNAVSKTADVYIRIPAERADKGKVTLLLQERFIEVDAITDNKTDIMPEAKVKVIEAIGDGCLIVAPID